MTDVARPHRAVSSIAAIPSGRVRLSPRSLSALGYLVIAVGAAVWTSAIGALAVWRHNQFLSHRFDLGNVTQAVWSSAHGQLLEVTLGTGEQASRLASHVDPALLLFVPFWWIHPGPETLIVVQAAALAAGVYPVVRLALKYVGSPVAAALLAGWYLAFPWLVWNAVNDVHAVTLSIPLLLFAIWFLDERHLGRFVVVAVLAMLTGELVGLTVAALGVWYAIRYRRARAGLGIAIAGTAWTAICLAVVIPAFNDGPSEFYGRFESVGGSPTGLATTLVTDPMAVVDAVTAGADGAYVLRILLPTAFVALGAPVFLIVALPQLAVNLLSDWGPSTQPEYQYVAPLVAVLIGATIMALRRFSDLGRLLQTAVLLAAAITCLTLWPPIPGGHSYLFSSPETAERVAAMRSAIGLIPPNVRVTATNRLGAHLSGRRVIHQFPVRPNSDWIVIDTRDLVVREATISRAEFSRLVSRLEGDLRWIRVFERAGVRVYRRVP